MYGSVLNAKIYSFQSMSTHLQMRSEGREQFSLFQTFSPADMHWKSFHQLIPEAHELYLNRTVSLCFSKQVL